ncbi:hypothetical protein [Sporichthya sp.]|uniref:hypothetical protein n=1 Tax=Sporichthya sp. TaxID=65475 RepID=UPI0017E0CBF2|nr:hypothetical protein [Sporichthya sp.]MBA3741794.1 hypothetical protein [Sporichthya sp.]
MALDLFAGIAVADYSRALAWYRQLLGSEPFILNDAEAVWELPEHRFLVVEARPERAARAAHRLAGSRRKSSRLRLQFVTWD